MLFSAFIDFIPENYTKEIQEICEVFHTETVQGEYTDREGNICTRVYFDDVHVNELGVLIERLKKHAN